jgi:hypothetical protein
VIAAPIGNDEARVRALPGRKPMLAAGAGKS